MDDVAKRLTDEYLYQKELILERAGVRSGVDRERLRAIVEPRMTRMAEIVRDWDVTPAILMAAVFSLAKRERHPDGPMPSLLVSQKYLVRALSLYLDVPTAAVLERRSLRHYFDRQDAAFLAFEEMAPSDLVTDTQHPAVFRYLLALLRFDTDTMYFIAPELLQDLAADSRTRAWAERRGVRHDAVARLFNNRKRKETQPER